MRRILGVAIALLLVVQGVSFSGNNTVAKVAVHVMSHAAKRSCANLFPDITECEDIVYTLASADVDCFPVFFDLSEYKGCEYGLSWQGTYSCVFTSCSDLTIGDIVDSGDGVSHTWTECQNEDIAIPGWAWIYEPDSSQVCVIEHPDAYAINILDCSDGLDEPWEDPYCAGIGGEDGDNPCDYPTASESSTWGSVKSLFR